MSTPPASAGLWSVSHRSRTRLSVAELTIALMLSLARRITQADSSTRGGKWERQKFTGGELFGKTLGLIGLGRIGLLAAQRALAFGMNIAAFDPMLRPDSIPVIQCRATLLSLDELLKTSDYISIHVPETPQTRNMLNYDRLSTMKLIRICDQHLARRRI